MDTDNGTSRQFFITEKILSKRNGGRIHDRVENVSEILKPVEIFNGFS